MKDSEKLYANLIDIIKLFSNRPHHLAKYLIENESFTSDFINKILDIDIDKLGNSMDISVYFTDISQMTDYFNYFSDIEFENEKSIVKITEDLNDKLDRYIKEERYEDAIRIRDYMNKNRINRKEK